VVARAAKECRLLFVARMKTLLRPRMLRFAPLVLALAASVSALLACSGTSDEEQTAASGASALSSTGCPHPFVGHDTPDDAVLLGSLTDGDGYQDQTLIGSIAVGQTVYFRLEVTDVVNLRNPQLSFATHSVFRRIGREDIHDTADSTLDVEVTYVCDSSGTSVECDRPATDGSQRPDTCGTMWGGCHMKVDCSGVDETGRALVRVTRNAIGFGHAQDFADSVPRSCGLTYVGARNLYGGALPK
jgi:hypothetical protein